MINTSEFKDSRVLIPDLPGVYKYRNAAGEVIYVGKAKNLKNRLSSYFIDPKRLDPKTRQMISSASTLEWTIVSSEIEALTLEYSYIQKFHPYFNIDFRDDKSYPYLAIDYRDEFPRVFITRKKRAVNIKYFGPFTQVWALKETLKDLTSVFPMRVCTKGVFNGSKTSNRACLLGFIGKCLAPCVGNVSKEDYMKTLDNFSDFMYGNTQGIRADLKRKMRAASERQEYEEANQYKKKLEAIDIVLEKNSAEISDTTSGDFFAITSDELSVCIYSFYVSSGLIIGEQHWLFEKGINFSEQAALENIFFDLYNSERKIPGKIFISIPAEGFTLIQKYLEGIADKNVKISSPSKGKTHSLIEKALSNAEHNLQMNKLSRFHNIEARNEALEEIQATLEMKLPPMRAECYDISHTDGNYRTGSMVVFIDGMPKKAEYRTFNVKNNIIGEKDDTHAIYEVISRRLANIGNSKDSSLGSEPNLIVIDGGIPQVHAANAALEDYIKAGGRGENITLISLAKRLEEVFTPDDEYPLIFSRSSKALYMLQQLRDESHRFAIIHHRARRTKGMLKEK